VKVQEESASVGEYSWIVSFSFLSKLSDSLESGRSSTKNKENLRNKWNGGFMALRSWIYGVVDVGQPQMRCSCVFISLYFESFFPVEK
jgi:hypothetical protein